MDPSTTRERATQVAVAFADACSDAGIDADLILKVTSEPADAPICEGVLAGAVAYLVEEATLRPIFGIVQLCQINEEDFGNDLSTTVHEVLHVLVRPNAQNPAIQFGNEACVHVPLRD
jgi:hypothetical protein